MRSAGRLGGLLLVSVLLCFAFLSPTRAQETPEPTAGQTPAAAQAGTVVRIEIDAPEEPVPKGEQFEARVVVENVEHLAGFDFSLAYDPDRVRPVSGVATALETPEIEPEPELSPEEEMVVRVLDLGLFLAESERGEALFCPDPVTRDDAVIVSCNTLGPPVCVGGLPGASGSGVLGRVLLESRGGGETRLELAGATLVLDDLRPCDPEGAAQSIEHRLEGATVELAKGGGIPWVVIVPIVAVVAVLLVGGAGFFLYRRRSAWP